jgi:membrane protein
VSESSSVKTWKRAIKALAQRLVFATGRFQEHELANHAAAGAYAFLLSAIPAVLLALGLATAFFRARPEALSDAERAAVSLLGPMTSIETVKGFIRRPLGGLAAAAGILSLLYSARLLIVTIQRGLRVIWSAAKKGGLVRENILGFALELAALLAVVAVLAISEGSRYLIHGAGAGAFFGAAMRGATRAAPVLVLLAFVYLTYRYAPPERPSRGSALVAALLCVVCGVAFSAAFSLFLGETRYDLLYGLLGNLILLLANVYIFFSLFFAFAEVVYIEEHFDALLFARFQRNLGQSSASRIERALFAEPERLLRRYGRSLNGGEKLFSVGEGGREVYIVKSGGIGIYIPSSGGELRIATLEAGEIFGEMALMRGEARSATARAERESLVLIIPAEVFEIYMRTDDAPRRLAEVLSERLRKANERLGSFADEAESP